MTREKRTKGQQVRAVVSARTRADVEIDGFDEAVPEAPGDDDDPFAGLFAPGGDGGATVEDIEDLLADLQLQQYGLPACDPEPAALRAERHEDEIAFLGLSRLVCDLITAAPTPATALDLHDDEDVRRAAYEAWRGEAHDLVEPVWEWLAPRRRRAAEGRPWWCTGRPRALAADTLDRIAGATEPVPDLAAQTETWARTARVHDATAEHNWRWLLQGQGLCAASAPQGHRLPRLNDLLGALVAEARGHGLLPSSHKVKLVRRPGAPRATPVRLPGYSLLSVPTRITPTTVAQLQRHIAALSEHALRPRQAPLAERWSLDPLRSAGWGLLLGQRVHSPGLLVRIGFEEHTAVTLAPFLAEHQRFVRGLAAVDLALDAALAGCRSASEAMAAAEATAARTGLRMAPELLLLRQPRVLGRRCLLAAHAWHENAEATLAIRWGVGWPAREEAWSVLLRAVTTAGTAGGFLAALTEPAHPVRRTRLGPPAAVPAAA